MDKEATRGGEMLVGQLNYSGPGRSELLTIVKNNNCTQRHLGDIGIETLMTFISLHAIRAAKASQTAQNMNTLFEAIGLLRLFPSTLSLSKLL